MSAVQIGRYDPADRNAVLDLSVRAWQPVFEKLAGAVPAFVHNAFYPVGWQARQRADLAEILDGQPDSVFVATLDEAPVGWVCVRLHPSDSMGEIYVLAVDPEHQRRGIGASLMAYACDEIRAAGMTMVMAETGDDPGHAAARASYLSAGFERWPVARYFKDLSQSEST